MKKLINDPANVVAETLAGFQAAHADLVTVHYNPDYVVRADAPVKGKVGLTEHSTVLKGEAAIRARFKALQRFLDYVQQHDKVWICRRIDIAQHWIATHPAPAEATQQG